MNDALLEVEGLEVCYALPGGRSLRAVDGVAFALARGERLGVVGESGCGKSTLARAVACLGPVSAGSIRLAGLELTTLRGAAVRALRKQVQMVFQNPRGALDPHMRAGTAIEQPLINLRPAWNRAERQRRVRAMMERVGLGADLAGQRPAALSGGQCQRVVLARALIVEPQLLVCDEPLSGLDLSLQAQVTNLLLQLVREMGLTLLLIAHDLPLVRYASDRVLVMYLGRVVEVAPSVALHAEPQHPYTRALIASVLPPDTRVERIAPIAGEPPSPTAPPGGCAFRTRCSLAVERCARERPALRAVGASLVACHRAGEAV